MGNCLSTLRNSGPVQPKEKEKSKEKEKPKEKTKK